MTRLLGNICKAMSFDKTGKYFYYFDSFSRYVIDVSTRSVFHSSFENVNPLQVLGSTKAGFEDITVTVDTDGFLKIWDDFNLLDTYSRAYPLTMVDFTENSDYLITFADVGSSLAVWKTNFGSYASWYVSQ